MADDQAPKSDADQVASSDQAPGSEADRTKSLGETERKGVDFINPEPAPVDKFRPSLDAPEAPAAQPSDGEVSPPPAGGDGGDGDQ